MPVLRKLGRMIKTTLGIIVKTLYVTTGLVLAPIILPVVAILNA